MKKAETDKARQRLLAKIGLELGKGTPVKRIAEITGYTTQRIYQIKAKMAETNKS